MSEIKTTHVGSLPRSNELSDLLFKKDQKEEINLNHSKYSYLCIESNNSFLAIYKSSSVSILL